MDSHHTPSLISIRLRGSESDPFGNGVTVHLGSMGHAICPGAALAWIPCSAGTRTGTTVSIPEWLTVVQRQTHAASPGSFGCIWSRHVWSARAQLPNRRRHSCSSGRAEGLTHTISRSLAFVRFPQIYPNTRLCLGSIWCPTIGVQCASDPGTNLPTSKHITIIHQS